MRYQKGQSGNPKGRPPKGLALSDLVCAKLAEDGNLEAIIAKAIAQAKGGDKDARMWLGDRGWGRALQPQVISGADGGPLEIVVRYANG